MEMEALTPLKPEQQEEEERYECKICMETFKKPYMTKCGHSFCYECIIRILKKQQNCPICREELSKNDIFPNFTLQNIIDDLLGKD